MAAGMSTYGAGRTVSRLYAKFSVVQDPNNKKTQKEIALMQRKLALGNKRMVQSKKDLNRLTKEETRLSKEQVKYKKQITRLTNQKKALDKSERKEINKINRKLREQKALLAENEGLLSVTTAQLEEQTVINAELVSEKEMLNKQLIEHNILLEQQQALLVRNRIAQAGYLAGIISLGGVMFEGIKQNMKYIEDLNVINQLYGENTDAVVKWASTVRQSYGLARTSALDYVATLKAFTKSAGIDELLGSTISIVGVQLAADLASFRNVSFDTAFRAIVAGLAGISRTLRYNFGVDIGDEALGQRFGSVANDSQAEKIVKRFVLLLESTKFVVGDFQRTKNSPANQIKLLRENFKEFSFLFAQTLLPMVNMMLILLNKILEALIMLNKLITVVGGSLVIANLTRGIFKAGIGGFFSALTLGRVGFGGFFAGLLQTVLLSKLIGSVFKNFSANQVLTEQTTDSYLTDSQIETIKNEVNENGLTQNDRSININIDGNATTDSVEEMVYQINKERMTRGI